jgi:hypothetical protein
MDGEMIEVAKLLDQFEGDGGSNNVKLIGLISNNMACLNVETVNAI